MSLSLLNNFEVLNKGTANNLFNFFIKMFEDVGKLTQYSFLVRKKSFVLSQYS